jgi:hypothetical protein
MISGHPGIALARLVAVAVTVGAQVSAQARARLGDVRTGMRMTRGWAP